MDNKRVSKTFFLRNRKGQEGPSYIIALVIGLAILVIVILGLTMGWDRVFPFFFSTNNVDNIKTNCAAACATNNEYSYCAANRTLKAEDLPANSDGKAQKSVTGNCTFFSANNAYTKYGIDECSTIICPTAP